MTGESSSPSRVYLIRRLDHGICGTWWQPLGPPSPSSLIANPEQPISSHSLSKFFGLHSKSLPSPLKHTVTARPPRRTMRQPGPLSASGAPVGKSIGSSSRWKDSASSNSAPSASKSCPASEQARRRWARGGGSWGKAPRAWLPWMKSTGLKHHFYCAPSSHRYPKYGCSIIFHWVSGFGFRLFVLIQC